MNAADVIAYTYDADYHCIGCTEEQHPGCTDWRREDFDPANYVDTEGNEVHPLFASDEWWEPSGSGPQVLVCSDCGGFIDELGGEEA